MKQSLLVKDKQCFYCSNVIIDDVDYKCFKTLRRFISSILKDIAPKRRSGFVPDTNEKLPLLCKARTNNGFTAIYQSVVKRFLQFIRWCGLPFTSVKPPALVVFTYASTFFSFIGLENI